MRKLLVLFLTFFTVRAHADTPRLSDDGTSVCIRAACFSTTSSMSGLPLRGVAEFRYWGFPVYTGALYGYPRDQLSETELGLSEIELRLTYQRSFSPEDFIESGEAMMREVNLVPFDMIATQTKAIRRLYREVSPGDSYSIHFKPGSGLTLALNDLVLGAIPGDDFGKAYLGIWLSEQGISRSFRSGLLNYSRLPIASESSS